VPAQDVGIRGGGILLREPGLDPVCPPRKQGWVHLVQGDVNPLHPRKPVKRVYPLGELVLIIEVPAGHPLIGNRPDLDDLAGREEDTDRMKHVIGHNPRSLFSLQSHSGQEHPDSEVSPIASPTVTSLPHR